MKFFRLFIIFAALSAIIGLGIYLLRPSFLPSTVTPQINEVALTPTSNNGRFVFLFNPARELSDTEVEYVANHYDIAVIGYQSDPQINSARRIKALNPNIQIYFYFPASLRQKTARYGTDVFREDWYLHDSLGNRISRGTTLDFVDLTQPSYTTWAKNQILEFSSQADFRGVLMDNAINLTINGIGTKNTAWNSALTNFLTSLTSRLNQNDQLVIYNGLGPALSSRNDQHLSLTNGALNEYFCYDKSTSSLGSRNYLLEDIRYQQTAGNNKKIILQKVNWDNLTSLPSQTQSKLGNLCYGVFLMGHVPGYTYFKFGQGYNLKQIPQEYETFVSAYDLSLGSPSENYQQNGTLLTRKFANGYVVVNINTQPTTWTAPRQLQQFNNGNFTTISAQQAITVPAQSALFFLFNATASPTAPSQAGDLNGDSLVNLADYNMLVSGYGTTYNLSHYNQLVANYGR